MKHYFLILIVSVILFNCANPGMPTGGPADKEPPVLKSTTPENGALNFKERRIRFDFDEYVQQAGFKQAFRIEPSIDVKYNFTFKSKSVIVEFDRDLPENTTVIATVGVQLVDFKNNKIKSPITLALSTGEEINSAKVQIKVLNATDGKRAENIKMFLIPSNNVITDKALYTAETDSAGNANFAYLPEANYKILLVEDVNRNRIWDSFEWAQPAHQDEVQSFKDSTSILKPIYFLKPDTVKPRLEGIGLFAQNRLRLRFSEPVYMQADSNFVAISEQDTVRFRLAYMDGDNPTVYWAFSRQNLSEGQVYTIPEMPLIDQFRNHLEENEESVTGELVADTTSQRILSVLPKEQMTSTDTILVTYSTFIDKTVTDSLIVIEQENQMKSYSFIQVDDHQLKIFPEKKWDPALSYQFRLFNPLSGNYLTHSPKIIKEEDLGELSMLTGLRDSTQHVTIEISGKQFYKRITTSDTLVVVPKINEKEVLVRAFVDENNNDKWDSGSVNPFKKPEPFFINPKVAIKQKMTTELIIEF
ncbi:hypothetical protein EP331_12245 [bacterium]|nr:MAG: hypothetical protein EP331_12245 [bacterium]